MNRLSLAWWWRRDRWIAGALATAALFLLGATAGFMEARSRPERAGLPFLILGGILLWVGAIPALLAAGLRWTRVRGGPEDEESGEGGPAG